MILTKLKLIEHIEFLLAQLKNGDSMNGSITYQFSKTDESGNDLYEVGMFIRFNNKDGGQGSVRFIHGAAFSIGDTQECVLWGRIAELEASMREIIEYFIDDDYASMRDVAKQALAAKEVSDF